MMDKKMSGMEVDQAAIDKEMYVSSDKAAAESKQREKMLDILISEADERPDGISDATDSECDEASSASWQENDSELH